MITHFTTPKKVWHPDNFSHFSEHYPQTLWAQVSSTVDRTEEFKSNWHNQSCIPQTLSLVLTPGLFAEWLPHCFRESYKGFIKQGHRCLLTPVSTQYDVMTQAKRIESSIFQWLNPDENFIWCTHSKGGIDALWALEHSTQLQQRCTAIVMVQLPTSYSWVIEDLRQSHTLGDRLTNKALNTRWLRNGIASISKGSNNTTIQWLHTHKPKIPALHAVSWSIKATSWTDSWHKRLTRMRPGHAHDGQFFLQDQRLDTLPIICLPDLDHAQPVIGGNALDTSRLWSALAHTAYTESTLLETTQNNY